MKRVYSILLILLLVIVDSVSFAETETAETDNLFIKALLNIAPEGKVLDLQEVINQVSEEHLPTSYESLYVYYFDLREAVTDGEITDDQAATLAHYVVDFVSYVYSDCASFLAKPRRGEGTYLTISFSADLAVKREPYHLRDEYLYGIVKDKDGSFFRIVWEDGTSDSFYYVVDENGNKKLMESIEKESIYKQSSQGDQSMFLGAYLYWNSKDK